MKKLVALLTLSFQGAFLLAQLTFPTSNDRPIWSEAHYQENFETETIDTSYHVKAMLGDTLIHDTLYSKVYDLTDSLSTLQAPAYLGALREDVAHRVFYRPSFEDREMLLYDFGKGLGDTIRTGYDNIYFMDEYVVIDEEDSLLMLNGEKRRRLHVMSNFTGGEMSWVEGIGSLGGLLQPFQIPMDCKKSTESPLCGVQGSFIVCFSLDDELIYKQGSGNCYLGLTRTSIYEKPAFKLYPNPVSDYLVLQSQDRSEAQFCLYSITGRKVFEALVYASGTLDVSRLERGLYFYRIHQGGKLSTGKVLVE